MSAPHLRSILFLTTCSLTKRSGGEPNGPKQEAITALVAGDLRTRLLERREEVRRLVKARQDIKWQGVALRDLEYNEGLVKGTDFGGHHTAAYLPAIERYQGRFYQALGDQGRRALRVGDCHGLILSGLYGLLRPAERIQVYSCPLAADVAETWDRDSLLTDVLCDYIDRHEVLKVFDLLAIDAYRQLIDWQRVVDSGTEVLHCFDAMASGESALTSLGMFLTSGMLTRTEDGLINLRDGDRVDNVMFRSSLATPEGFPAELAELVAARNESDIRQPWHLADDMREIVRGGNPSRLQRLEPGSERAWRFTLAKPFRHDLRQQPQLLEPVIAAIMELCANPFSARGNTVKPLVRELAGMWRYRIGNFRLIYRPDEDRRVVDVLALKPRGRAYE